MSEMRLGGLQWVLLLALFVCALQLPVVAAAPMPHMTGSTAGVDVDTSQIVAGQPMVEPCCALQAAPTTAHMSVPLVLSVLVISALAAGATRPPGRWFGRRSQMPAHGLRGRPLLHAYLN
jgi:hypothetical protein